MRLTKKTQYGYENESCEITQCSDKLGPLEDIEEELGIDLITLVKALKNGVYYKGAYGTNNYGKIAYQEHPTILFEATNRLYCFKPTFFDFLYFNDYGKTWALTKEVFINE